MNTTIVVATTVAALAGLARLGATTLRATTSVGADTSSAGPATRYRALMAKSRLARSGSLYLAFTSLVLLGLCVAAMIRRQDVLAGALAALGLGATVLGALMPRLTGIVEMGLSGFKMEVAKLSEVGRRAGYSDEDILAAIEDRLGQETRRKLERELRLRRRGDIQIGDSSALGMPPLTHGMPVPADEYEEIRRTYTALAQLDQAAPERPGILIQLGTLLINQARRMGHHHEADNGIAMLRQALELVPKDSPLYVEALKALTAALEIHYPTSGVTHGRKDILPVLDQLEQARRSKRTRRRRWPA